jgi:Na+-exporting ATPase
MTNPISYSLGKMALKKAWVPSAQAEVPKQGADLIKLADIDTRRGARYVVETGSDPYYPRGTVKAVTAGEAEEQDENDFDDAEAVHPNHLEPRFRHLVLCGVSLFLLLC